MNNILIVEDDNQQAVCLSSIVTTHFRQFSIYSASTISQAKDIISNHRPDICLIDTSVNGKSGFDFATYLRKQEIYKYVPIIFVTSDSSFINEAVNSIHCYGYVLKPYSSSNIIDMLSNLLSSPFITSPSIRFQNIYGVYVKVSLDDILYVKSNSRAIKIVTQDSSFITKDYNMQSFSDVFSNYFIRIHKQYIVNASHITAIDTHFHKLHLEDCDIEVPIGTTFRKDIEYRVLNCL